MSFSFGVGVFVFGGGGICFDLLSWLDSGVLFGIDNELNDLETVVKITKRKHWLKNVTINTTLGIGTSVSLELAWNLRGFFPPETSLNG